MTILVDDTLVTAQIAVPLREGWVPEAEGVEVRAGLKAEDVGAGDVALLSIAEATRLAGTHLIEPSVAVVLDGVSPIAMRTPVRPDGVEETVVRLIDTGPTAELAARALLNPYFGIVATSFVSDDEEATEAQVVVLDGFAALDGPEAGHQEDLAKAWFVLTGSGLVSHVTVVGLEAEARDPQARLAVLAKAVEVGAERKRDVRRAVAAGSEVDREVLAEMTNRFRYALTAEDRQSAASLVARGGWGGRFARSLPLYRDQIPAPE